MSANATVSRRRFPPGNFWPNEEFVVGVLCGHFGKLYDIVQAKRRGTDIKCFDKSTKALVWHVEAKGLTKATRTDFQTLLGQLVMCMDDPSVKQGVAVPDDPEVYPLLRAISPRVRQALNFCYLLVDAQGAIRKVKPTDPV